MMALQEQESGATEAAEVCGIGPAGYLLSRLRRLGVENWEQVLLCVPKGFSDYAQVIALHEALPSGGVVAESSLFSLVVSEPPVVVPQPKPRVVLSGTDSSFGGSLAYWDRLLVKQFCPDRFNRGRGIQWECSQAFDDLALITFGRCSRMSSLAISIECP